LKRTEPLMELVIRWEAERHGSTPGGRQRSLEALAPLLKRFPAITRAALVRRVADVLYLPENEVQRFVRRSAGGPRRRESQPAPKRAAPVPPGLRHLLWLLLHHHELAAPIVQDCDPAAIAGGHAIRDCIGSLLRGRPLPEILENLEDEALAGEVASLAASQGLYSAERVEPAVRQILAGMERARIQSRLQALHRELQTMESPLDKDRMREILTERASLGLRLTELNRISRGDFESPAPE